MIVLVFVVIWLLVLVPLALRRHSEHRLISSVARFRRQRQLLDRAFASRLHDRDSTSGVPDRTGPTPLIRSSKTTDERIETRRHRRRSSLSVLGTAFALTFILGFIPALRGFWIVTIALAILLAAYLVLLVRCVAEETGGAHSRNPAMRMLGDDALHWENGPAALARSAGRARRVLKVPSTARTAPPRGEIGVAPHSSSSGRSTASRRSHGRPRPVSLRPRLSSLVAPRFGAVGSGV